MLCLALAALPSLATRAAEPSPAAGPVSPPLAAVPAARKASNPVVITIHGEIDRTTAYSVQRRIKTAQRMGADAIIFELNTPGGDVIATLEICNAIKNSPIPNTIAWVNPDAYSAGTFIALACREIVTSEYATMGDAAPIQILPGMGLKSMSETERQKMLAPLLSEMVDSARRRGYDEKMVQGFVSLGVELWLVQERESGRRLFITEPEYRMLFGDEPPRPSPRLGSPRKEEVRTGPTYIPAPTQAASEDPAAFRPASPTFRPELTREVTDSLDKPSERPILTPAERGRWELIDYATSGASLLVLKAEEMRRYGFSQGVARNDADLASFLGASAPLWRLDESWSEGMVRFFSGMVVRGVLIAAFLIAMFIELAAPGISVAGGIAGLCLIGLLVPSMLIGASGWWTAIAVLAGIALILTELLLFPGTIIMGAAGLLLLFGGLVGTFVTDQSGSTGDDIVHGVAIVMLAFFVAGASMYFIGKAYGTLPVFNRLILTNAAPGEDSGRGMLSAMASAPADGPVAHGAVGRAVTDLRPAGAAQFDGRMIDVVSEVGFIERGAAIRTVSVTAFRVGVEIAPDEQPGSGSQA